MIIVHEVEPGVFVHWPSGRKVMRTFRTANLVFNDGRSIEQPVEPYEAEEKGLGRSLSTFSDDELADRKLYRASPFVAPQGKQRVGAERFERVDGVVRQVFDVEDEPPPPPPPPTEEELVTQAVERAGFKTATEFLAALSRQAEKEAGAAGGE